MSDQSNKYLKRFERERAARLEAERLLEEKSEALYLSLLEVQSSQGMLQSALASMADGFLLLNRDNEVVLANDQLRKIYSRRSDIFAVGGSIEAGFEELITHPDFILVKDRLKTESYFEIEFSDKTTVSVSLGTTPEGYLASTHRDITELKHVEVERRQLLIDLMRSQRMEAIGRMSGMIAHDFNNIIASIKGFAGFLQEDLPDDPALHGMVHRILSATARAQDLIKQILEYGNQQQGAVHQVSIIPVVEDCIEMLEPTMSSQIEVSFYPPEKPVWIKGNESRLGQLFTNLLTNAARALGENCGRISVLVETRENLDLNQTQSVHPDLSFEQDAAQTALGKLYFDEKCAHISVCDTGEGMDQPLIDKVFEMYFTTRSEAIHGGIGMSSVAEVVSEYGGGIKITSEENQGTIVEVVFPLLDRITSQLAQTNKEHKDLVHNQFDVLLIDDDKNVGEMIQQMLERSGISVEYFTSSQTARHMLLNDQNRWKLVISDQIMPEIKGTDIYTEIRQKDINIPFFICSGNIDPGSEEIIDSLRNYIISKPVDREMLLEKISPFL
jgi:signal transduction histidine kinase